MLRSLVGSEMCIRDRYQRRVRGVTSATMVYVTGGRVGEGPHRPPLIEMPVRLFLVARELRDALLCVVGAWVGQEAHAAGTGKHDPPTRWRRAWGPRTKVGSRPWR
eukprot:TRINITY_DN4504_c0_g1_i2.p2 TRINITY_DN4504_c0_g1~~TRINITY_DN4504_c0_g1_i2.p2  ORF type:complete len:106 (-),score=10.54 TRINITY_DN4504_c0_g1_i2:352-669(-)